MTNGNSENSQGSWAPPAGPMWEAPAGPPIAAPGPLADLPTVPAPIAPSTDVLEFGGQAVEKKRGLGGRLAVVGVALAVVAGAGYAVTTALNEPAGPESPEEVADALVMALEEDDMLAIIELMAPSEREAFVEPGLDLLSEISRLEGVEFDADGPQEIPGEFTPTEITYDIEPLGEGVYWLTTTGGEIRGVIDPADLPSWVTSLSGESIEAEDETMNLAEDPLEFVIIAEDGGFYWSLSYTAAESMRNNAAAALPDFGHGLTPVGAASPAESVETALMSIVQFDPNGAATQLDPREFRAFYDYAPLFMGDATESMAELQADAAEAGFSVELTELDLSADETNGRTLVYLNRMVLTATVDGESDPAVLTFDNGCVLVEAPGESPIDLCDGLEADADWDRFFGPDSEVSLGVQVVERDGRWYLSGAPTFLGMYTDILRAINPDEWADFRASFSDGFDSGFYGVADELLYSMESGATDFEPVGPAIDSDPIDGGPPDLPADVAEIDPVYVARGYMIFPTDPVDSYATFALDIGVPVTSTMLTGSGSVELWEYESPAVTEGFESYLVDYWSCELITDHGYGEGATVVVCDGETYVRYDRWVLQTWGIGEDALGSILAELDHLRSFG